ncbi:major capsid protein [Aeromonas veronii]|uniref:major capsid protein n=1 Tax=Aeromonas veronii TaxID=654 RepID=UPI002245AC3A|nr:major capsid protein [Aeromonas veronii]MCX0437092.1 major capsid protein [Aeromonas veronii]
MSDVNNFIVSDFSTIFQDRPVYNRLLQSLGMFGFEAVDQSRINFDYLINNKQSVADSVARYGSEAQSTPKAKASLHQLEIPHFVLLDTITPEDWQGKRVAGQNRPKDAEDCIAEYLIEHYEIFEDTIEKYFADCLFRGIQNAPYTQESVVDLQAEFGLNQQVQDIDWTSSATDVDGSIDDIQIKIKTALGSKVRMMDKVVCVCGPTYFKAVKANAKVREAFTFVKPYEPQNIIHNFNEILPTVQYFDYNGVLFIMTTDPLHGVDSNTAFFFPKMRKESGVFKHFGGPASRHGDMATKGGQRYFQYQLKEARWANYDVVGEMGLIAVNHLPNIVVKSENKA